jgi:ribonuclease P protein component
VLSAQNRMTRSTDFDATIKYGTRAVQPDLVVYGRRGSCEQAEGPTVGLIVARSVGSAVQRHRVARRLRHVARPLVPQLERCQRVVIRALPSSRGVDSARLEQQLRVGLQRIRATGSEQ